MAVTETVISSTNLAHGKRERQGMRAQWHAKALQERAVSWECAALVEGSANGQNTHANRHHFAGKTQWRP